MSEATNQPGDQAKPAPHAQDTGDLASQIDSLVSEIQIDQQGAPIAATPSPPPPAASTPPGLMNAAPAMAAPVEDASAAVDALLEAHADDLANTTAAPMEVASAPKGGPAAASAIEQPTPATPIASDDGIYPAPPPAPVTPIASDDGIFPAPGAAPAATTAAVADAKVEHPAKGESLDPTPVPAFAVVAGAKSEPPAPEPRSASPAPRRESAVLQRVSKGAQRAASHLARVLSAPMARLNPGLRTAVGVVAIHTFVLAGCLWAYAAFGRGGPAKAHAAHFDFEHGELPAPPDPETHGAGGHGETGGGEAAGGHGEAPKDAHAKDDPKKPAKKDAKPAKKDSKKDSKKDGKKDAKKDAAHGGGH